MCLAIERGAYHVILILNYDYLNDEVINKVNEVMIHNNVRKLVLHVISSEGRPTYLEKLRTVLSSTFPYSLVVRYWGSTVDDLVKIIKLYRNESMIALVSGDAQEFKGVLEGFSINYELLGVRAYA